MDLPKLPDNLSDTTTEDLFRLIADAEAMTVAWYAVKARVWAELCKREEKEELDLSRFRDGNTIWYPAIAAGRILPEVVYVFSGFSNLIACVGSLPLEEQARLVGGGAIIVAVPEGDGFGKRCYNLRTILMRASLAEQVFGEGYVRSFDEQKKLLTLPKLPRRPNRFVTVGKVEVDTVTGYVRIGRSMAAVKDVVAALVASGVSA